MNENEKTAEAGTPGGQTDSTASQFYLPRPIPSTARVVPLEQAQMITFAALRLFKMLTDETWVASSGLEHALRLFIERVWNALYAEEVHAQQWAGSSTQPPTALNVTAAESAMSTRAEAQARVAAKRAARLKAKEVTE